MPVVAGIDDDIEEVEAGGLRRGPRRSRPSAIYFLKREVIEFHRAVWPLLAPLESIARGAFPGMDEQLRRYLRDVADHAQRVDEIVNSQRELLTSVLEANLALVSVRQNEVVKKISGYAALIAVPTFIASVYGMNFEHMPELDWPAGYPLALAADGGPVVVLLLPILRRAALDLAAGPEAGLSRRYADRVSLPSAHVGADLRAARAGPAGRRRRLLYAKRA